MKVKISDKILPNFNPLWKACKDPNILNVVAKGGRNSSKSTTISIRMIYNRMRYNSHGIVIRKIGDSIRRSCREQLIWAINHLGVEEYWYWSKSLKGEMTLIYKPTDTKIFFEGAYGNTEKIKGYKMADKPVTDVWIEEMREFKEEDEVTEITNSFVRDELPDGLMNKFFFSYNPPKRKQSWLNKKYESVTIPSHTFVHHSNYLDNPFVNKFFIMEAEHTKSVNIRKYEHEYLGKPIGSGVVPFDNLTFRTITDDEYESFDNIRQGCDWGYSVDPVAFIRWHYDKTRKIIYAMNEIEEVKMSNEELARRIKSMGLHRKLTVADSSEPKSVAQLINLGCNFTGAKKGQGSVEYGEKWLDELEAIVIDPQRTPKTAKEFESIDYQVDKDGNTKAKLEDKDNHVIDATRYAFEQDMKSNNWGI